MVKTDSDSGLESESVTIYRLRFLAKLPTPVDSDSDSAALLRTYKRDPIQPVFLRRAAFRRKRNTPAQIEQLLGLGPGSGLGLTFNEQALTGSDAGLGLAEV